MKHDDDDVGYVCSTYIICYAPLKLNKLEWKFISFPAFFFISTYKMCNEFSATKNCFYKLFPMLWEDQVSMYTWEGGEEEEEVKLRQKQFSAAFEKDIQHPFLSHIQTHFHIEKEIKKKAKKITRMMALFLDNNDGCFICRMASYSSFSCHISWIPLLYIEN